MRHSATVRLLPLVGLFGFLGCSAGGSDADAGTPGEDSSVADAEPKDAADPQDASSPDSGGDAGPTFRVSLSVSPFAEIIFDANLSLSDGARVATDPASLQQLLVAHGSTEVFARIGTRKTIMAGTGGADSTLARGLERARLAEALGLPLNPELGLFRTYGDVSCQTPPDLGEWGIDLPGAWETLTADQMAPALQEFGAAIAEEILATGVSVEVWDIGNEVDLGTAGVAPQPLPGACDGDEGGAGWYRAPDGVDPAIGEQSVLGLLSMPEADRIAWLEAHLWPHEALLLGAVAAGVRSVAPGAKIATHISNSTSATFAVAFYGAMRKGGFAVDVAGFSFYPSASETPPDRVRELRLTVEAVRDELGLPSFIAEYAYPAEPMSGTSIFATWNHAVASYPIDEAGQHDLLFDLASWGASGALTGIRPWAPEVFVGDWAPMVLFRPGTGAQGVPRAGLDAIAEGISHPDPLALKE